MTGAAAMPRWVALGLLLGALWWARAGASHAPAVTPAIPREPPHDIYGGLLPAVAPHTGNFRVVQLGKRWTLLSPEGGALWLRAVYGVDWSNGGSAAAAAFASKYHGHEMEFARHAVERLRLWGFNALGTYENVYTLPVPTYGRRAGNAAAMPFLRSLNVAWYGELNDGHLAPAPFKSLLAGGVDPEIYHDWKGNVPDVFDPNFAAYAQAAAADQGTASRPSEFRAAELTQTPWLIGTIADDSDDVYGFGPGPDLPGDGNVVHPNLGWVIAVTRPEQQSNDSVGAFLGSARRVEYRDPTVYSKLAWSRYLRQEYKTIAALNAAWGSHYTTFGSDGGWPSGRGLLDESGRNGWIGADPYALRGASAAAKHDMDAFVGIFADRYYQVTSAAIRGATPRQLVFSGMLDGFGGMTRPAILAAAARYCDVVQLQIESSRPEVLDHTYALTHKPLLAWLGVRADADSAVRGGEIHGADSGSQAARGAVYAADLQWMYARREPDGVYPVIGFDWWEYMDKPGEHANWGLVTVRDNAYDGREDRIGRGQDAWGYATGGESGNHGDFLTRVTIANLTIAQEMRAHLPAPTGGMTAPGDGRP